MRLIFSAIFFLCVAAQAQDIARAVQVYQDNAKVSAANPLPVSAAALPAGTNLIGKVSIDQATANANEVVTKTGSVTAATLQAGTATIGSVKIAETTATNPGTGLPGTDVHFKECGHVNESKNAGTDVLAWCILHFN